MTEIDGTSGRPVSTTGLHILYILHAVAPFTLWSLSFVAVIMGAFMRDADRGTYLESHYAFLLRHLDALGWKGYIGCEYRPRGTTLEGLGWMREFAQ